MDSKAETESPFMRNLDKTTASMTVIELNNLVVSFRPNVRKAKVAVVHKLTRQIAHLRKLKGTEEQVAANNKKADRYGLEVDVLKKLNIDLLVKNALKNTSPIADIGKLPDSESRILLRIACQKTMVEKVEDWRGRHDDWKSLAAYLLSKNSGRRYKKDRKVEGKEKKSKKKKQRSSDKAKPWEKKKDKSAKVEGGENQSDPKLQDSEDGESDSDSAEEMEMQKTIPKAGKDHGQVPQDTKVKSKVEMKLQTKESSASDDVSSSEEEEVSKKTSEEDNSSEDDDNTEVKTSPGAKTDAKQGIASDTIDRESEEKSEENLLKAESDSESGDIGDSDTSDDEENDAEEEDNDEKVDLPAKVVKKKEKPTQLSDAKVSNVKDKEMVVKKLNLNALEESSEIITTSSDSQENVAFLFKNESGGSHKVEKPSSAPKVKKDSFFCRSDSDGSGSEGSENDSDYNSDSHNENVIVKKRQESAFIGSLSSGNFGDRDNSSHWRHGKGDFHGQASRFGGSGHSDKFGAKKGQGYNDRVKGLSHNEKPWQDRPSQSSRERDNFPMRSKDKFQAENRANDSRKRPATEDSSEKIHPSWAASKKRKEQQSQIQAFQGKKIIFDDDD